MKTSIRKILGTTVLFLAAGSVNASDFYIDNGANFAADTDTPTKVNDNSTGVKEQMTVKYQSSTDFFFGGNGVLDVGDSIVTQGGLAVGGPAENLVTSLNPGQVGIFGNADNGFNTDWFLSFSFTDLTGTVNGFDGAFPTVSYTGGTINFLYSDTGANWVNFMDLIVTGSALIGGANLDVFGNIDFTTVDGGAPVGLFHDAATGLSFYDIWLAGGSSVLSFNIDQNTDPNEAVFSDINGGINIKTNHDGSVEFNVPEPATLALMGIGLIGFGGASRRRSV